jgi:hypothetical protein
MLQWCNQKIGSCAAVRGSVMRPAAVLSSGCPPTHHVDDVVRLVLERRMRPAIHDRAAHHSATEALELGRGRGKVVQREGVGVAGDVLRQRRAPWLTRE